MATQYDELFTDDKLNIQSYVVDFAHIIEQESFQNSKTSKVYSLDGEFGIGKTFFCTHLIDVLKKDRVRAVKLNIWDMECESENPLLSILYKLNEMYQKNKSILSKIGSFVFAPIKGLFLFFFQIITSIFSAWLHSDNLIDIFKASFHKEPFFKDLRISQKKFNNTKKKLVEWGKKQNTPIVMVIDELDRCKPDYAVKTLETLKHFFDIPGFVFVLAIDEKQLKNSVETLFGTTNFDGYKRKFINNTFLLPSPDRKSYAEFLYDESELPKIIEKIQADKRELLFTINICNTYSCAFDYSHYGDGESEIKARDYNELQTSELIIKRYFAAYSGWFKFTLRQMEQVFDRLVLFIKQLSNSKQIFSPDLAVLLVCLHEFDIKVYNLLRKAGTIERGLLNTIGLDLNTSFCHQIYKENSYDKLGNFSRKIAPECMPLQTFSVQKYTNHETQIIHDNIDRFFVSDDKWRLEQQTIKTEGILLPETPFDLTKFKKDYFKRMDFISHFE